MSDWKKKNEDWRDEDKLEEEEESECPWVDSKGKVRLAPRRPPTVRQQLLDYYRCLQRWRVRYAPQSPTEELHPCFLEAIKNLDIVEYYLDCSVLPDPQTENELRKYWEGLHERLEKEERRLA